MAGPTGEMAALRPSIGTENGAAMAGPTGEMAGAALRVVFDRRLKHRFCGSVIVITSDAGLLVYRELDDAFGLTTFAGGLLAEARTGRNGRHAIGGLLRQSVFGRLAGYEGVNDVRSPKFMGEIRLDDGNIGIL